jgi:hypothetical protein
MGFAVGRCVSILRPIHQLRQIRKIYRYPSRFISCRQIGRCAPAGFSQWREALDRVIAAQMRCDGAKLDTPGREAADREHEAALVVFRALAEKRGSLWGAAKAGLGSLTHRRSHPSCMQFENFVSPATPP